MQTPQVKSLEEKLNELLKGYSFNSVLSALTNIADEISDACMQCDDHEFSRKRGQAYHKLAGSLHVTSNFAAQKDL